MTPDSQQSNEADAVRDLAEIASRLADDPARLIKALTKMLTEIEPGRPDHELTADQVSYLIETGAFIVSGDHEPSPPATKIKLQLVIAEHDYIDLLISDSLSKISKNLGWEQEDVLAAVAEGRLCSIEVLGLPRFPNWQFHREAPDEILPGLPQIIEAMSPEWSTAQMDTCMGNALKSLGAEGSMTPTGWLLNGGDVDTVIEILKIYSWDS